MCETQRFVLGMAVAALGVAGPVSAEPAVSITGGPDETGQRYDWQITHEHTAPLVYVEFPHFRGDRFYAPDGWTAEVTNRNSLDFQPGRCIAEAGDGSGGLARGEVGAFRLHINSAGAPWGKGTCLLRFADGIEAHVTIDVPVKRRSAIEPYATPAALGGMFGLYLLVRAVRRRRRASS